jgi:hypothetical protein
MPVAGEDCLDCQCAFPASRSLAESAGCVACSIDDRIPNTNNDAHASASAGPFSHRVSFSIADHIRNSNNIDAHGYSNLTSAGSSSHRVSLSIADHMRDTNHDDAHAYSNARSAGGSPHRGAISIDGQMPKSNSRDKPGHVVSKLKSCLQELGIDKTKSDYIVHSVTGCLADTTDESTPMTDPAGSVGKSIKKMMRYKQGGRTMMMCNIPCRVSHDDLVEVLESKSFGGTYAFVHLPCRHSFSGNCNLGYAFVHFLQMESADRFALELEGYAFDQFQSTKTCTIKVADWQGHDGNSRRPPKRVRQALQKSP